MWDNLEDAFKDLDSNEYNFFAKSLGSYLRALMVEGFTREEAFNLVESYSKFVYDMVIEEMISKSQAQSDDEESDSGSDLDDVDEV